MAKPSDKRARTVEDAAFTHLQVFVQPVWSWPTELAQSLPAFEDLYVLPLDPAPGPGPIQRIADQLQSPSGPSKVVLTGQKGSGKSWGLKWLARELGSRFAVVSTSVTDSTGVTLPDADVTVVLFIICERLCGLIEGVPSLQESAGEALTAWLEQVSGLRGIPDPPRRAGDRTIELGIGSVGRWFAKVVTRLRSDEEMRKSLRAVPADDLLFVTNALLALVRQKREPLVILDDVDKLEHDSAERILTRQYNVLARIDARMVLTCPVSLALQGLTSSTGGALPVVVLRNVKVIDPRAPAKVYPDAIRHFRELVGRLMEPTLVEPDALAELVRLGGGVNREFGQILARAAVAAHYLGAPQISRAAVDAAALEARIDLSRNTQFKERRESLGRVHKQHQLETAEDRKLLDLNMLIEYVNGELWYDVHPLLVPVVESWSQA